MASRHRPSRRCDTDRPSGGPRPMRTEPDRKSPYRGRMTNTITRIDFVPIPTQDAARATAFYGDTLGLTQSEHTVDKPFSEFDLGGTTLSIWDPTTAGM